MQIDELRGELSSLADEIEPFESDLRALHGRERRRRVVVSSLAIALVAVVGASTIAVVRRSDDNRVRVAAGTNKEVRPEEITHFDAIIVPASPAVKAALDASPLVTKYVFIPQRDRSSNSLRYGRNPGYCALQTNDGYAVDVTSANVGGLTNSLVGQATVYDVERLYGADAEFYMNVEASEQQVESLQAALEADPDIASVRHVSRADAYEFFKEIYAYQPALIESTKASQLPESFRIVVKSGISVPTVTHRYEDATGVADAIGPFRFDPDWMPEPGTETQTFSPCAKP
jgi:hypothetical protein